MYGLLSMSWSAGTALALKVVSATDVADAGAQLLERRNPRVGMLLGSVYYVFGFALSAAAVTTPSFLLLVVGVGLFTSTGTIILLLVHLDGAKVVPGLPRHSHGPQLYGLWRRPLELDDPLRPLPRAGQRRQHDDARVRIPQHVRAHRAPPRAQHASDAVAAAALHRQSAHAVPLMGGSADISVERHLAP